MIASAQTTVQEIGSSNHVSVKIIYAFVTLIRTDFVTLSNAYLIITNAAANKHHAVKATSINLRGGKRIKNLSLSKRPRKNGVFR